VAHITITMKTPGLTITARREQRDQNRMGSAIALRERKQKEKGERLGRDGSALAQQAPDIVRAMDQHPSTVLGSKLPRVPMPDGEYDPEVIKPENCNYQDNCPLFNKLSADVRDLIYKFVFLQYEVKSRAYPTDAPYCRPGNTAPKCIDTALLYTCRIIYVEARLIPLKTAAHEFWCGIPAPEHTRRRPRIDTPSNLTVFQASHIRHLIVNTSTMSFYQQVLSRFPWSGLPFPLLRKTLRTLTISIGYTGWTLWEFGKAPDLDYFNFFMVSWPDSLREFTVRLETMEIFKEDLDDIVGDLVKRKVALQSQPSTRYLSAEGIPPKVSRWTGPHSKYLKDRWADNIQHLGPRPEELTEMWYYVVEVTWR
jgi:hypothetical protein